MHEAQKDTQRALEAAKIICDGRHPMFECPGVLITLDHVIATVLIAAMGNDPKKALAMFNEGTIPSVEERIMLFANKSK